MLLKTFGVADDFINKTGIPSKSSEDQIRYALE